MTPMQRGIACEPDGVDGVASKSIAPVGVPPPTAGTTLAVKVTGSPLTETKCPFADSGEDESSETEDGLGPKNPLPLPSHSSPAATKLRTSISPVPLRSTVACGTTTAPSSTVERPSPPKEMLVTLGAKMLIPA